MSAAIRALALALALALAAPPGLALAQAAAVRITEAQVRAVVDKVTAAANKRDVPSIMQVLADDVVVIIDFRGPTGKRQRLKMNRAQYEAHTASGMREMDKYSYRREKVEIAVASDGQSATVKSRSREIAEYQGNTVVAAVDEETTLKLRDGRVLVTEVRGFMR
jgi:ketosteroid isomerase-like protein